jgi:hypothetical protein
MRFELSSIFIDSLAKLNFEKAVVVFQVKLAGHTDSLKDCLVFRQIRTKSMPESCRKDLESLQATIKGLMSRLDSALEVFHCGRVSLSSHRDLSRLALVA